MSADDTGIQRAARIQQTLGKTPGFWEKVHSALDKIGFDKAYCDTFHRDNSAHGSKSFKDSIWGMMEFAADEVALIDSPLIQRLRSIKQNGFTYLTYPSAEHTRFAHTLGVAHVVKRFLQSIDELAIRRNSIEAGSEAYPLFNTSVESEKPLRRHLIHAALLHDCGHLAFSHAGETAVKASLEQLDVGGIPLKVFQSIFARERFGSDLSERLSIAICLSPRFTDYYRKVDDSGSSPTSIYQMCCLIGGVPHLPGYPGLINLISGEAIDADKIDYINRDARECGVPVGVDVARVFLHSALIHISPQQAQKLNLKPAVGTSDDMLLPGVHFVINSSGIDTYDEITIAKAVLYNRVYLHHLTRNAEQVFSECIARIAAQNLKALGARADILTWFEHGDQSIIDAFRKIEVSSKLAERLRLRRLPRRAFALFRAACTPFVRLQDIFNSQEWSGEDPNTILVDKDEDLFRLTAAALYAELVPVDSTKAPAAIRNLVDDIKTNAMEARQLVDDSFAASPCEAKDVYVALAPRVRLKPSKEVLVREKSSIGRSISWTKSEEVTDAYRLSKDIDYFYGDAEWLPFIQIAAVKVLYMLGRKRRWVTLNDAISKDELFEDANFKLIPRLGLDLEEISGRVGFNSDELGYQLRIAAEKGFFGSAVRAVPLTHSQQNVCVEISEKFKSFLGERGWQVTKESTAAFVRQFPVTLRDEITTILKVKVRIVGRGATRVGITKIAKELLATKRQRLIFCRFSPNSGNYTGILFEQDARDDFTAQGHIFCRNLAELERVLTESADGTIIFLDDQFGTGGQAEAQLRFWAGQQREDWPEDIRGEQNIDFSIAGPIFRKVLSVQPVVLAFVYGTPEGQSRVEDAARALGYSRLSVRMAEELPTETAALSPEMRTFLESVGFSVLKYSRGLEFLSPAQEDVVRKDALGYGGKASVVVTPLNAPSHMITALWCPGVYDEEAWVPLFIRRGYRKHLVLS